MFSIALFLLIGAFADYFWGGLRQSIHMMQLNSYFNARFLRWVKGRPGKSATYISSLCALLCILPPRFILSLNIYLLSSAAVFLLLALNRKKKPDKKPLVYTWRVRRLLIGAGGICALFLWISWLALPRLFWRNLPVYLLLLNLTAPYLTAAANAVVRPGENYIARRFRQDAKRMLREHPGLTVIGITGSYGKTSTKRLLSQLLDLDFQVLATPESYNTTMGVIRTIREKLSAAHQIFIVEMGAKKSGDIKEICELVEPSMGLISSIGEMHLDTFQNMENIINTKFELAEAVGEQGLLFLNYDNAYIRGRSLSQPVVRYGLGAEAEGRELDVWAENIEAGPSGSRFDLCFAGGEAISCRTKLLGRLNVLNIVAAAAVAARLGLRPDRLGQLIARLEPVPHRLQLLGSGAGFRIIDDAFNANPEGAKQALETLSAFPGLRVLVTPGMVELGDVEDEMNRRLGIQAAGCCDFIIIVGKNRSAAIVDGAGGVGFDERKIYVAEDIRDAMAKAKSLAMDPGRDQGPVTVLLENDLPDNYLEA